MKYKTLFLIFIIGMAMSVWIINKITSKSQTKNHTFVEIASAERENSDDEEDDEREDEDEDEEENTRNTNQTTQTVPQQQIITVYKKEEVKIVEPGFDIDTDKDKLVDAVDPHPTIPETELFTDVDQDSIPNALDKYPNEDDLSYIEFQDVNTNGIRDDLE